MPAGKKKKTDLVFDLDDAGITTIEELENVAFYLMARDADSLLDIIIPLTEEISVKFK